MEHEILIESELERDELWAGLLRETISAALAAEGVAVPCEVDVLLTDDEGIHQINLEQRGVDAPTDVLSFPMFEFAPGQPPAEGAEIDPETGLLPLGDMVVSMERARAQGRNTPRHQAGAGLSGRPLGAPPPGLRPHGRRPAESPDAGAGGSHPEPVRHYERIEDKL
jgi:rRNA maturation RNase YbeY